VSDHDKEFVFNSDSKNETNRFSRVTFWLNISIIQFKSVVNADVFIYETVADVSQFSFEFDVAPNGHSCSYVRFVGEWITFALENSVFY
jgi:hypothetical protein